MKTILTFVGGGDRDAVILQTALAAASPLSAHLDCLHAHRWRAIGLGTIRGSKSRHPSGHMAGTWPDSEDRAWYRSV